MINDAYLRGEKGMWKESQEARTSPEEITQFMEGNKLILAYSGDNLEDPVASVFFTSSEFGDKKQGELGMLAAKLDFTGKGVGRQLISKCEERAKEEGCHSVQLELLQPSEWVHPTKAILHQWYSERLGYKMGKEGDFAQDYPQMVPFLAGPTKFTEYVKQL